MLDRTGACCVNEAVAGERSCATRTFVARVSVAVFPAFEITTVALVCIRLSCRGVSCRRNEAREETHHWKGVAEPTISSCSKTCFRPLIIRIPRLTELQRSKVSILKKRRIEEDERSVVHRRHVGSEIGGARLSGSESESTLRIAGSAEARRRNTENILILSILDERVLSFGSFAVVEPSLRSLRLRTEIAWNETRISLCDSKRE